MRLERSVTIVILTWNGLDYTKKCINSLRGLSDVENVDVVVFDNGSTDGTLDYLKSIESPSLKLIASGKNLGFVRGNNAAINQVAEDRDIILLNNDVIVDQDNWIELLQETALAQQSAGVIGCRLRGTDGNLQHAGTYILPDTFWGQQIGGGELDINQYGSIREVEGVVFACAYIKREVISTIGLLNEAFESYFEDSDYCLRARRAGYKVLVDGRVTLSHKQNTSTALNKVDFSSLFEKSRAIFKNIWAEELNRRYLINVNWSSIANFETGYAVSSRNLMIALDGLGVNVRYKYVYGPGTPFPVTEREHFDDYRLNAFHSRGFSNKDPEVVYAQGDVFKRNRGKYKIGYTMLEVDGVPKDWVEQSNLMDEVWVPSTFNVETFRESGVRKPIHVVPLGIDPNYFNAEIHSSRIKDRFTFLSVFEWGERKSPEMLLRAFSDEFKNDPETLLICKIFNRDGSIDVEKEISKLGLEIVASNIVILLNHSIPGYQMGSFYRSADCFVLPTRGEGWGMPVLEAMACGLPVISTNWSSTRDFFDQDVGFPIEVETLVNAEAKCPYYKGFRWALPSEEHLRYLMRYVRDHPEEAGKKALAAAQRARTFWTWDHAAQAIIERLRDK